MRPIVFVFFIAVAVFIFNYNLLLASDPEENKGAEQIALSAGKKGDVPFPHARHQVALKDCNICHHLFPQKAGSIQSAIAGGKMKTKTVMKECQECHRKMSQAGEKTGPTSCSKCHASK